MTATAHEGQGEDTKRERDVNFKRGEDTCDKTEVWRKRNAHDTALEAKIKVKLDPEAGLDVAQEHSLSPKP